MLKQLLWEQYGLAVDEVSKSAVGAGSDTYFVTCGKEKYVLKFSAVSAINQPEIEPALCEYLLKKDIPACRFLKNKQGKYLSKDMDGRTFHVQEFIEGNTFELNQAPDWFLLDSAHMLGRIHEVLKEYKGLPVGIGEAFFQYMTPENAEQSYRNSLKIAESGGDAEAVRDLQYRIELVKCIPKWKTELSALTCASTHGDYFISQIICGESSIHAVIDWTTACVHPVVWEIIRSYVYASPRCTEGAIDMEEFSAYITAYLEEAPLTPADIRAIIPLFRYQLAVCDYYGQYYSSDADNRDIYLHQAKFSTKLLRWLDDHGEVLEQQLAEKFI